MVDQLSRLEIGATECPWRLVGSAAKVLDFIQFAWIFYPDDLDLDFIHQILGFFILGSHYGCCKLAQKGELILGLTYQESNGLIK